MSQLAQHPDRLHPPEDFLDSFPLSLAYLITRVSSGALVQPASAATLVLGDMRCNSHASQFLDELPLVVSFLCAQRDSPAAWQLFRHQQPGMTLRRSVGRGHLCVHHQSAPILRHQMPVVAQFRFLSWSLAGQHGLRIGGGTVCLISAFLSAIVDRGVILVPPSAGGFGSWSLSLPTGSTGRKLLCDAQASSNVPSTVKCSSLSSCPARASPKTPERTLRRCLLPACAPGSWKTCWHPTPRHPCSAPQTSGTAGCNPVAPSAAARFALSTATAATRPAAASRERSTADRRVRRAC